MTDKQISGGTVHDIPDDLRAALTASEPALQAWETLTPLARNEWICWTTYVKQSATRQEHVERVVKKMLHGVRRPCCWIGCIHRTDKAISPSIQGILAKRSSPTRRSGHGADDVVPQ